jgi:hypothetical protein
MEKYGRASQATDGKIRGRMRIVCWLMKVTDTRSEYVILIDFPLQQWLWKRASVLRYACTASLVIPQMFKMLRPSQFLVLFTLIIYYLVKNTNWDTSESRSTVPGEDNLDDLMVNEVIHRVKEERNILHTVQGKANWTGHIFRRNCF